MSIATVRNEAGKRISSAAVTVLLNKMKPSAIYAISLSSLVNLLRDFGCDGPRKNLSKAGLQMNLSHSVSDRGLEKLFEEIDAGQRR